MSTRLFVPLLFVLMAGLSALSGCKPDSAAAPGALPAAAPAPLAVRVAPASRRTMRRTLDYVGTVRASSQLPVTSQLPGTLESVDVQAGDRVRVGQAIARIKASDVEARRGQIRAEIQRAQIERDYLCERLETDKKLEASGAIHSAQLDASQMKCAVSQRGVQGAQAKLRELQATLAKGTVRSPVDGYVLERVAEPGENVGPGKPLLILAADGLEVRVPVNESDLRRGIAPRLAVVVQISDTRTVEAQVDEVAPLAKGPGRSAEVTIALPADTLLRQGMSAGVRFVLDAQPNASAVPAGALRSDAQGDAVFVLNNDTVRRVAVTSGIRQGGWVQVKPALDEGARVAVSNLDALKDGSLVYPVEVQGGPR